MAKITSENWLETPNNMESFQKVESLFESVRIKRNSQNLQDYHRTLNLWTLFKSKTWKDKTKRFKKC